jgi:asparagine synthase (glutamine-hydrolysing)
MCGIVGVASANGALDGVPLEAMRDAMRHRGPDDAGAWRSGDGRMALGHRRLSIVDLSPAGRQPMADPTGRVQVVFNGEIYNFRELRAELAARGHAFATGTDTEVLVQAYLAWGTACVERLNGMFAFALYDAAERRLFAARDRAGEKPLFYAHRGATFAFASELKALLADPAFPREIDPEALEHFLAWGYVPGPRCILAGVSKLPAGHALTYELERDRLRVWRYWRLPVPALDGASDEELTDELERLLEDAVRRQLVADVPVGVLLSGGLDSSLVTALAVRVSATPVRTFTVSFPGERGFDEGPYARMVAEHFGTEHTELAGEAASVELLAELARQYDEPIGDSSLVPTYLVSRLIRRHATVALGGDGGDELFGGYLHYTDFERLERLRRVLPRQAWALLGRGAGSLLPVGTRGRALLLRLAHDGPGRVAAATLFDPQARRRLLGPAVRGGDPERERAALQEGGTLLRRATASDFGSYLVDDILVKVDRASMLASLEVRAPWLDHRIVEFAFSRVPDRLRATRHERKVLTRRLGRRLLPPALDLQRKQGFSIPLARWFGGRWGEYITEVLSGADPHLFDAGEVQRLLRGQRRGAANSSRLFALTLFELWRREYRVALPGGAA